MRYQNVLLALLAFSPLQLAFGCIPNPPTSDGETPASLSCIYGLTSYVPGCTISGTCLVPQGGSGTIAVIEGADDPDAYNELTQFSAQFNLTPLNQCSTPPAPPNPPCFQKYYASSLTSCAVGSAPSAVEIVEPEIDMEWAHAMAPNANIYMIETDGWDFDTLINGIQCANRLLAQSGGIVSLSASFPENQTGLGPNELSYDSYFQIPGIIYITSSGDFSAPARYPSSSPYVISAGGTMINRDSSGNYLNQVAWNNTGPTAIRCDKPPCRTGVSGGPSAYEPRPSYQNTVQKIVGTMRGTPDISFVAQGVDVFCCSFTANLQCCNNPNYTASSSFRACQNLGTSVCPTSGYGLWVLTGGTSLASPALAGIINSSQSGATTSAEELSIIYNSALKNYHANWTDIIFGNNGYPALQGYDFTTGLGVPRGYGGK